MGLQDKQKHSDHQHHLGGNAVMKRIINRILAITLIFAAIAGLLFNIGGVFLTWRYKNHVTSAAQSTVRLLTAVLDDSVRGLDIAIQAIDTSIRSVNALQNALQTTANTLEDTKPILEGLAGIMEGILPVTVASAQAAVNSAEEGARVIDSVLRAISSLPFISPELYNPETPLHEGLANLSASLDGLPRTFQKMSSGVNSSRAQVEAIQQEVTTIAADVDDIENSLEDARSVLTQYQTTASDLSARLKRLDRNLPVIMTALAALFTFIFIWLSLAMVGLLLQCLEVLGYRPIQTNHI